MKKWLLWGLLWLGSCLVSGCVIQPLSPPEGTTIPVRGAAGLGDTLFPNAGNGGYDVQHYDLDLTANVDDNIITSTATLTAVATLTLDAFNLDFHALEIDALSVNGVETPYERQEDELIIDPAAPLPADAVFTVSVRYHGKPNAIGTSGWLNYLGRVAVTNGSLGAATWYPLNNHASDRATYSYRIKVPPTYMALVNGQLLGQESDASGWTTYRWATDSPMISAEGALMIGRYVLQSSTTDPAGTLVSIYREQSTTEGSLRRLEHMPDMLALLNEVVGPYPFPSYSVVIHTRSAPYANFQQELSILSLAVLTDYGEEAVMNGLSFQYFGNSVGIAQRQDLWLIQGLGGYLGWFWIEKSKGPAALQTMVQRIHNGYSLDFPPAAPATAHDLDNDSIYFRAPMAIHALRLRLGDERFFQLLRTFYARYRGDNASTADFIAVAEEVSGEDLTEFFQAWLYDDKLPPLPAN
ncbi:MAG: M1 family metallopeptidase [Caldilineaceae bacterium]